MSVDIVGTSRIAMTEGTLSTAFVTQMPMTPAGNGTELLSSTANSLLSPDQSEPEPMASLVIRLALITLIFLFTVVGNALTIYVIKQNKPLRSIKNYYYGYYLLNLSVSDLFVGVICIPFTVIYYQTEKWPFGSFFCKLMPTMQVMSISASISTLTYITFERYQAIVNPMKPRSTLLRLKITIAVIWIWSLIVGVPSFTSYQYDAKLPNFQCQEQWGKPLYRQIYTVVLFLVNYAVPLVFIFLAYARIIHELRGRSVEHMIDSAQNRVLHRRFVKLMLILVISFALCYLPNNVMFFLLDFTSVKDKDTFGIILNYTHVLVWLSSCLNPFVYGSLDSYFKRGYKKAIGISSSSDKGEQVTELNGTGRFHGKPRSTTHTTSLWASQDDTVEDAPDFDAIFKDYKANKVQKDDLDLHSPSAWDGAFPSHRGPVDHSIPVKDAPPHSPDNSSNLLFGSKSTEEQPSDDSKEIFISLDSAGYTHLLNKFPKKRSDLTRQNALINNAPANRTPAYSSPYCSQRNDFGDVPESACLLLRDDNDAEDKGSKLDTIQGNRVGEADDKADCTESKTSSSAGDDDESGFVSLVLYHDKDRRCLNRYVLGEDRERLENKRRYLYSYFETVQDFEELGKLLENLDETTL